MKPSIVIPSQIHSSWDLIFTPLPPPPVKAIALLLLFAPKPELPDGVWNPAVFVGAFPSPDNIAWPNPSLVVEVPLISTTSVPEAGRETSTPLLMVNALPPGRSVWPLSTKVVGIGPRTFGVIDTIWEPMVTPVGVEPMATVLPLIMMAEPAEGRETGVLSIVIAPPGLSSSPLSVRACGVEPRAV